MGKGGDWTFGEKDTVVTPLFSLRENAIALEPGLSYPERWRCVS